MIVVSALLARCSKAARYSGGWSRQIVKIYISIMIHHWLKIFLIAVTLLVPGIIGVYHQTVLRSLICPNFPMAVYDGSDKNAQMFLLFLPVRTESKSLPRPIMIQLVNSNHSALVSIMTQTFRGHRSTSNINMLAVPWDYKINGHPSSNKEMITVHHLVVAPENEKFYGVRVDCLHGVREDSFCGIRSECLPQMRPSNISSILLEICILWRSGT